MLRRVLAALLLLSSSVDCALRAQAFLPRLSLQPDPSDAAQAALPQELLDSVCLDTRKPWGTATLVPAVSGSAGSLSICTFTAAKHQATL